MTREHLELVGMRVGEERVRQDLDSESWESWRNSESGQAWREDHARAAKSHDEAAKAHAEKRPDAVQATKAAHQRSADADPKQAAGLAKARVATAHAEAGEGTAAAMAHQAAAETHRAEMERQPTPDEATAAVAGRAGKARDYERAGVKKRDAESVMRKQEGYPPKTKATTREKIDTVMRGPEVDTTNVPPKMKTLPNVKDREKAVKSILAKAVGGKGRVVNIDALGKLKGPELDALQGHVSALAKDRDTSNGRMSAGAMLKAIQSEQQRRQGR